MKALLCKEWGPPEKLTIEELPDREPGEHEAVIRVHAAGVNFPDTLIIQKKYQVQPELPFSPGTECAGVVSAVGAKVENVKPGDRVIAFSSFGAFAEQVVATAERLVCVPKGVDLEIAASFAMVYGTSYHALLDRGSLQADETVLILGASGGVGLAGVQIAKVAGARVIAAASSAAKLDVCRQYGADEFINYETEDLRRRILDLTAGKGVDVVLDPVGGPYTEAALRSCAWRGRLLIVGFANGGIPRLAANLPLLKGCSIVGVFWGDYNRRQPQANAADLARLFAWLEAGKLKPHIAARFPLERGAQAIRALMDRRVSGKVVIDLRPDRMRD